MSTNLYPPASPIRPQLLKVPEVAEMIGVKPRTIYEMVAQGAFLIAELMGHSDPPLTPQTELNELRWKPCVYCARASGTNLPQRKNGCQSWQP